MMPAKQTKGMLFALGASAFVIIIGVIIYQLTRPEKKVIPGGSLSIELTGADRASLEQLNDPAAPQAADPAFGGSGIEQSPVLSIEAWQQILKDELE